MNYAQLVQAIQDYCQSSETTFVANIPVFVKVAEKRIYNTVQLPALRKNMTGTMTSGLQYMSLPLDWLSTFSIAVITPVTNEYDFLLPKDVNFIRAAYPTSVATAKPKYYGIFSPYTMLIGPTPNANYQTELHYYYYPESIVTAGTSWVGENYDVVLLYGALREAYLFLKGEADIISNYESKYQEAIAQLKRLGDGLERQDAYRNGQVRVPVT
jgi:hypothetical protein